MKAMRVVVMVCIAACGTTPSWAQSLYERPALLVPGERTQVAPEQTDPTGAPPLAEVSLMVVEPPKPREFQEHDLVTIIVSERTKLDRKLDNYAEKKYDNEIAFEKFIDLVSLLEFRIDNIEQDRLPEVALQSRSKIDAKAKTKQEDELTDRLTARVLEVKPNGTLVLEARRSWTTDEDATVVTLSGICRSEDVTDKNTIQSNQMFDVNMNVQNTGEMRRSTKKGLIPRVLETIFNF